jgi:ureidoglycolate hydrolase
MDEHLLEIRQYQGEGYRPLIDFGTWRVAILRWIEGLLPERQEYMERHMQTDEVFVLLEGRAILILGGNETEASGVHPQVMESGKMYNVKQNTWHTILLSLDASVLIVENNDTGKDNTEYCPLTPGQKQEIMELGL